MFYVYKITNNVNGKVYIGKTGEPEKRWRTHLAIAARGKDDPLFSVIHKAINKYGKDNFIFEIIETLDVEQESLDREIYWIAFYKSHIYKYGSEYGYNLTAGGEGLTGYKPTEETRKKLSEACAGEKNGFYGKFHDDITKQLLSVQKKGNTIWLGRHHTDETKELMSENRAEKFDLYSEMNRGSKNPLAKLTEPDITKIYSMIVGGLTDKEIAKTLAITKHTIMEIRIGRTWKHVPRPQELGCGRINLTKILVIEIIQLIKNGISDTIIAKQFNVPIKRIQGIRLGTTWKDVPR